MLRRFRKRVSGIPMLTSWSEEKERKRLQSYATRSRRMKDLEVTGISHKENGHIRNNAPRKLIEDLDRLPFPAYHLFQLDRYTGVTCCVLKSRWTDKEDWVDIDEQRLSL
jgi:hypothetical protein